MLLLACRSSPAQRKTSAQIKHWPKHQLVAANRLFGARVACPLSPPPDLVKSCVRGEREDVDTASPAAVACVDEFDHSLLHYPQAESR